MRKRALGLAVVVFVGVALTPPATRAQTAPSTPAQPSPTPRALRSPAAFANIQDSASRSAALFVEAGKVLQHPRCVNCHPASDRPSQGAGYPHQPPVQRGADGLGVTAMRCATCHQTTNFDPGRVPGNPKWRLAPASMAWQGRSLADICAQVKDPARNGGHSLAEIVEHAARDPLVGWAWNPGADREPAPGTQAVFGALVKAWVASGAVCPAR
jgi:mono/diheme cytochrome c family protein